jgi:hypothetical protein
LLASRAPQSGAGRRLSPARFGADDVPCACCRRRRASRARPCRAATTAEVRRRPSSSSSPPVSCDGAPRCGSAIANSRGSAPLFHRQLQPDGAGDRGNELPPVGFWGGVLPALRADLSNRRASGRVTAVETTLALGRRSLAHRALAAIGAPVATAAACELATNLPRFAVVVGVAA